MDLLDKLETHFETLRKRERFLSAQVDALAGLIRAAVNKGEYAQADAFAARLEAYKKELKPLTPLLDQLHSDLIIRRRRKTP